MLTFFPLNTSVEDDILPVAGIIQRLSSSHFFPRQLPGAFDLRAQTRPERHAPDKLSQQCQLPASFLGAQTPAGAPRRGPANAAGGGRAAGARRQEEAADSAETREEQRTLHRRHERPGDQRITSVPTGRWRSEGNCVTSDASKLLNPWSVDQWNSASGSDPEDSRSLELQRELTHRSQVCDKTDFFDIYILY